MLRWSAFDPTVVTERDEPTIERPFDQDNVDRLVAALVAPPPDPRERVYAARYQAERNRRWKVRIEYPLLLALAGIKRLGPGAWKAQHCSEYTRSEWQAYREACADRHGVNAPIDRIELWYDWADRLAGHVAQSYRSGHVFDFMLGAAAVLLALTTLVLPQAKVVLAIGEFLAVVAILTNTSIGARQEWHRKWLDYRQLAERLRPMRSLKLLGVAAPDPRGPQPIPSPRDGSNGIRRRCGGRPAARPGDLTPRRQIRCRRQSPNMKWRRRSPTTARRRSRSSGWITGSRNWGTALFSASCSVAPSCWSRSSCRTWWRLTATGS